MDCTTTAQGQELIATIRGSFTAADSNGFRDVLRKIEATDCRLVVLDLSGLEFADSAALSLMILAHRAADKAGKRLTLRGLKGQVKRVFELTQLDEIFSSAA